MFSQSKKKAGADELQPDELAPEPQRRRAVHVLVVELPGHSQPLESLHRVTRLRSQHGAI